MLVPSAVVAVVAVVEEATKWGPEKIPMVAVVAVGVARAVLQGLVQLETPLTVQTAPLERLPQQVLAVVAVVGSPGLVGLVVP